MKENKFQEIDSLIRNGDGKAAKDALRKIRTQDFKAKDRIAYADLARRLSLPQLALRMLNPIVRPEGRVRCEATDDEKIEYAGALIRIGAPLEAIEMLESVASNENPHKFLFEAFAHIVRWNYSEAISFLQKYLEFPLSPYQNIIGRVNLCEALVHNNAPGADELVESTLNEAKSQSFSLAYHFVLLTKIENLISHERWEEAEKIHREIESALKNHETVEYLFVKKWGAILKLHQSVTPATIKELREVRAEARDKWHHWETVRDCDFYEALCTRNVPLMKHLYFGTPFEPFRTRLLQSCPELSPALGGEYVWRLGGSPRESLELFSGSSPERKKLLTAGKINLQLLSLFPTDFYRPFRTAMIASHLFPGEYYNPNSTPLRVRMAIHRTRRWLESEKFPLTISEVAGSYFLKSTSPISLKLVASTASLPELEVLRNELVNRPFTLKEACKVLSISPSSANRLVHQGCERGLIVRSGKGRAVRYAWAQDEKKSAA